MVRIKHLENSIWCDLFQNSLYNYLKHALKRLLMSMILSTKINSSRLMCIVFKSACPELNNSLVLLVMQTIHPNHNINYHNLYWVWFPADNSTLHMTLSINSKKSIIISAFNLFLSIKENKYLLIYYKCYSCR